MSENSYANYLNSLCDLSIILRNTEQATTLYWHPEPTPPTLMFSAIGEAIACHFNEFNKDIKIQLFNLIEDGMNASEIEITIPVATGLIEAIVSESTKFNGHWKDIKNHLGPKSLNHAIAWMGEEM